MGIRSWQQVGRFYRSYGAVNVVPILAIFKASRIFYPLFAPAHAVEYLYFAGDDRFGALGVSTSQAAYSPRAGGSLPRLEQVQQLSEVVAKIEASEPLSTVEAQIIAGGGSPLGGATPKALINIGGEQWVMKFFNNEPVDAPLIEHPTMTQARRAGITAAETQVIRLIRANERVNSQLCQNPLAA